MASALLADKPENGWVPMDGVVDCLTMVGDTAWSAQDWIAAQKAYRLVQSLDPKNVHALNRLGRLRLIAKDPAAAVDRFSDAFIAGAKDPATCVNLALAYTRLQDYTQALYWCEAAFTEQPDYLAAYIQKASIIYELLGDLEAVTDIYRLALSLHPESADVKFGLAMQLLRAGNYREGWTLYENRPDRLRLCERLDEYPEWRGEDLSGKTILVCGEQGLGDRIMFARYLPLLAALGADVVLYEMPEVARLLASLSPQIRIVTSDREVAGLEPDYWVAAGSLPLQWRAFEQIDIVGVPQTGALKLPYLWVDRPASLPGTNFKVGLCWKGAAKHMHDSRRSIAWEQMRELVNVPGVDFYSLQYGADESKGIPSLVDASHDLLDTARQMAGLDLVVTVDTAILHLAGAMGIPCLGLLYQPADWRWGLEGATTPWYESVRLFRQDEAGEWGPVLERVRNEIVRRVELHETYDALSDARECRSGAVPGRVAASTRQCRYGQMSWLPNDHYIGRALELYGEYSEAELDILRQVLKSGDTVVDVGANVGGLSYGLADAVGPTGRVLAAEPQPAYMRCLKEHAPKNIECHLVALGREGKQIQMRVIEERKLHAPGWASTGPEFTVQQRAIDDWSLSHCELIKIDVDGMEHEILMGAENTIHRCRPVLYVEYDKPEQYPDMLAWLLAHDYRLYQHDAPLYNPNNFRGYQVNVFGHLISRMILAIPHERKDLRFPGLPRIRAEKEL